MAVEHQAFIPARTDAVRAAEMLYEFLSKFALNDFSEVGTLRGTWCVDQGEDGPELELLPDLDEYLDSLDWIARGKALRFPGTELTFPCTVVGSERRIWLSVAYDHEERTWFYEYPGDRDDTALDREHEHDSEPLGD